MLKKLTISLFLTASTLAFQGAVAQMKVVTSFSILGDLAAQVGGSGVEVTSIVDPSQDAHIYNPTVADARTVAVADLIILNGIGFETWSANLVAASGTDAPILTVTDSLPLVLHDEEEDHEDHDSHDDHERETHFDPHDHGEDDPHAWGAIANGIAYAQAIEKALGQIDPENADLYATNFESFAAEALATQAGFTARISALPADHRTVVTSHDAFGYLAEETGLTFLAPQGINSASAATAGQVRDLIEQLQGLPHAALFVENITNPALLQQIADETGLELGGQLFSDALSGPDGSAPTYLDMYRHNMETILTALEDY